MWGDILTYKKERQAYQDAKQRCTNSNHKRFHDWGGRGIQFKFSSFTEFFDELGPCPEGHSLDRINNEMGYERGNVRWLSLSKQQHNKRKNKRNRSGLSGVRYVTAKGLKTITYQSFSMVDNKFKHLYCGPDFFEACCARKSFQNTIARYMDL